MTQIPLSKLSPNTGQIAGLPKNPRFIRDDRYEALQRSIAELPEMLELRELLVFPHENKYVVIAGNMRYRAMKDAGYKEAPCKVLPADMPPEKLREITIKDNVGYGNDDTEELRTSWDLEELKSWGMELPDWNVGENEEINVSAMPDEMIIKLKYTEDEYTIVRAQLSKIGGTPEQAVWKLLGND
jgi:ParB-like chromosome segregation protein Spo0J